MKKFIVLVAFSVLLTGCGETAASTATQHFSSTKDFFGLSQYIPDRNEQVTVTKPWRIVWQAHLDNKDENGFTLSVCQDEAVGNGAAIPECTTLVYNGSGSGTTAPITNVYGDVTLSMDIGGVNSTWSFDIEELS